MLEPFTGGHPCASAANRVVHGVVDLILHCTVARPSTGHMSILTSSGLGRGNARGMVQCLAELPSTSRKSNVNQRQLTGFSKRAPYVRDVGRYSRDPTSHPKQRLSTNSRPLVAVLRMTVCAESCRHMAELVRITNYIDPHDAAIAYIKRSGLEHVTSIDTDVAGQAVNGRGA